MPDDELIILERPHLHAKLVWRYKIPVFVFLKFPEYSFPTNCGDSQSTQ